MPAGKRLSITWLGHSTFILTSPGGKHIVTDPWLEGNPACPASMKKIDKADLILVSHGHFDHAGDVVNVARATGATVVGIFELCSWLEGKGVKKTSGMNIGGTQKVGDIAITMTMALHTSTSHAASCVANASCGHTAKPTSSEASLMPAPRVSASGPSRARASGRSWD